MIATVFPSVSTEVKLERRCPHCGRLGGQIHSRLKARAISDTKVEQVFQQRLRCAFCGTTWTLYGQGIGRKYGEPFAAYVPGGSETLQMLVDSVSMLRRARQRIVGFRPPEIDRSQPHDAGRINVT